jgi:uncharacterized membrane protein YdbT with pleckstrin-like domain
MQEINRMEQTSLSCRQSCLASLGNLIFSFLLLLTVASLTIVMYQKGAEKPVIYSLYGLSSILTLRIAWIFLVAYNTYYSIDDFFLKMETGVLNKAVDTMDLVKIKDVALKRSIVDRILGIAKVHIYSRDKTHSVAILKGLPKPIADKFFNKINYHATDSYVEYRRRKDYERSK